MAKKAAKNAAARALGRLGGRANTPAQNSARKRNAQLAGRPRRVCIKCNQPVVGGHVDRALDESCGAHGWRWERAGSRHPAPISRDRAALDAIAAVMAARNLQAGTAEWYAETVAQIAALVTATGREVP